jgi:hypothetical protein
VQSCLLGQHSLSPSQHQGTNREGRHRDGDHQRPNAQPWSLHGRCPEPIPPRVPSGSMVGGVDVAEKRRAFQFSTFFTCVAVHLRGSFQPERRAGPGRARAAAEPIRRGRCLEHAIIRGGLGRRALSG